MGGGFGLRLGGVVTCGCWFTSVVWFFLGCWVGFRSRFMVVWVVGCDWWFSLGFIGWLWLLVLLGVGMGVGVGLGFTGWLWLLMVLGVGMGVGVGLVILG